MEFFQKFILVSLIGLTLVVILLTKRTKKEITTMQGMTISMFYSMNIGLTVGVLFGVTFQGNLFYSTILSIIVGTIAGVLIGYNLGFVSILEGIMAGLMGGMMGAMLGEMINGQQSIVLIRIFLLLSVSTIFLFFIFPKGNSQKKIQEKIWLFKPLLLASLIAIYFIGAVTYAEKQVNFTTEPTLHSNESHTNITENKQVQGSKDIIILTENMKYSTSKIALKKNEPVTLTITNQDSVEHDFEVIIPFETANGKSDSGQDSTQEDMIHLHAGPNDTQSISFTPIESGSFEFICTIPGHKESEWLV